ncbi:MAG: hypothetical protein E7014_06345 [Alphaproteobacteria bacterium]|nr:hypothetical protein [Alphaproteobacteria bacterium]
MANETLAAAQQQAATEATQGKTPAQAVATPEVIIPDLTPEQAASVPGALVANSAKHQGLTKAYPSKDRQQAYARMRKIAAQSGGKYSKMKGSDGKPMDAEAYITLIEGANAKGVPVLVKGAGQYGGNFLFQPTQKTPTATNTTETEKDQGGFVDWCKRNWYWLVAGAAAIAVGIVFLVRHNRKKKSTKTVTTVTPTPDNDKQTDISETDLNKNNQNQSEQTNQNNNMNGMPGDGPTAGNLSEKLKNGELVPETTIGLGDSNQEYADKFWAESGLSR